ncbi:MAG TPA: hypothetical protein VMP11_09970 [Verrucomicrobiae bacterium]|nr:hypothetical protein [Verrucomicrobiae bacterium]
MMAHRSKLFVIRLLLVCAITLPGIVHAQTNSWTNSGSGTWKWETASNWSLGRFPYSVDSVYITNFVNAMLFERFKTVLIDAATWSNYLGEISVENLTVVGVGSTESEASFNTLLMTGSENDFEIKSSLTIGKYGTLSISNVAVYCGVGERNDVTTLDGTLQLDGGLLNADTWLYIGYTGSGQATVLDGQLANGYDTILGAFSGSDGVLTLAGGTNYFFNVFVADYTGAGGTVWVTGGQTYAQYVSIGSVGVGQMIVSNGAIQMDYVEVPSSFSALGSAGTLTVAGGTVTIVSNLVVDATGDCSTTGMVLLAGGELDITNSSGTAELDIRGGTFMQTGGVLRLDRLVNTNSCGQFILAGGTIILNPYLSVLGDGIPNGWKQQYGFDPFDPTVANADPDHDGFTNLQEYQAGTNPTNNASAFRIISAVPDGGDMRIRWISGGGRTNALQVASPGPNGSFTTNFTDMVWVFTSGSDTITNTYVDVGGATRGPSRFYRVRLVP